MKRKAIDDLLGWLSDPERKPMVVRGARQVGKTWLIRELARISNRVLLEINFERHPNLKSLFDSNNPHQILQNLEIFFEQPITPSKSLLFLDEIQAQPEVLAKLRWFAEDLPELPVTAAGSLLEFVLGEHEFSMPVGRINYYHLEPLSFTEFLLAQEKHALINFLASYQLNQAFPEAVHQKLKNDFAEYLFVGGLPAACASWVRHQSISKVNQIHHDLLATYRDDFAKYSRRLPIARLDEILNAVPLQLGCKFVYRRVNAEVQTEGLKKALQLLTRARLCHKVHASSANGVPLGAEVNEKFFKVISLDVGLVSAALGLNLADLKNLQSFELINQGGIAEQVAGQLLRTIEPFYSEPRLFYWLREKSGSEAEIDYLLQHHNQIIPIEIKSGEKGRLKSLHLFMAEKGFKAAVRINMNLPEFKAISVKTQTGEQADYWLLSLPLYMTEEVHRLLENSAASGSPPPA